MWGNLGLELNLGRMDAAEKAALAREIAFYKRSARWSNSGICTG